MSKMMATRKTEEALEPKDSTASPPRGEHSRKFCQHRSSSRRRIKPIGQTSSSPSSSSSILCSKYPRQPRFPNDYKTPRSLQKRRISMTGNSSRPPRSRAFVEPNASISIATTFPSDLKPCLYFASGQEVHHWKIRAWQIPLPEPRQNFELFQFPSLPLCTYNYVIYRTILDSWSHPIHLWNIHKVYTQTHIHTRTHTHIYIYNPWIWNNSWSYADSFIAALLLRYRSFRTSAPLLLSLALSLLPHALLRALSASSCSFSALSMFVHLVSFVDIFQQF